MRSRLGERCASASGIGFRHLAKGRGSDEHSITFNESQLRGDDKLGRREALAYLVLAGIAEQPSQNGT